MTNNNRPNSGLYDSTQASETEPEAKGCIGRVFTPVNIVIVVGVIILLAFVFNFFIVPAIDGVFENITESLTT